MWSGRSPDFEDEKYVVWQVCPSSSFFWPALVLVVENPPANAEDVRDVSSIPGLGRSPGGWHGNPLQYSCLENPLDGDWWTTFCVCVCILSCFSYVQLLATVWTEACHAPLSMGFSKQEYWSGLPCPLLGDLPNPGIKPAYPVSPALQVDSLPTETPGKPHKELCMTEVT